MKKKSKIPYIFIAFFATFITADLFLIYLAKKTWRGTVTEDSYEKGRKYNKVLLNNKKQKDLGWQADISHKKNNSGEVLLTLDLKDKIGKNIQNAKIDVRFVRPAQVGFDFSSHLHFDPRQNNYKANIKFPLIGLWKVETIAYVDDKIFQYVERIVIEK